MKKGKNSLTDVTMWLHDGAEVCELVGIYLLGELSIIVDKKNIRIQRDDDVITNGPKLNCLKNDVIAIFPNEGLKIIIDTNLTTANFLDVTLDLFTRKYYPYRKPNDCPLYVNANSNHPPTTWKQLPTMVNTRLSSLSINEDKFNKAKSLYEKALKSSDFNKNLKFESIQATPSRNKQKQWFGSTHHTMQNWKQQSLLKLVRKHFH